LSKQNPKDSIRQAVQQTIAQKGLPPNIQFDAPGQVTVTQRITTGPLPDPEILKLYNDAVPKGGDRLMKMAEAEQKHVHKMQYLAIGSTFVGEMFAFGVIIFALGGSFWLVSKGNNIAAGATFVSALGMLTAGYFERRRFQQKQAEQGRSKETDQGQPKKAAK
jgi:uncharacterized membrane protein